MQLHADRQDVAYLSLSVSTASLSLSSELAKMADSSRITARKNISDTGTIIVEDTGSERLSQHLEVDLHDKKTQYHLNKSDIYMKDSKLNA